MHGTWYLIENILRKKQRHFVFNELHAVIVLKNIDEPCGSPAAYCLLVIARYIDIKVGLVQIAAYIFIGPYTVHVRGIRLQKKPFVHLSEPQG